MISDCKLSHGKPVSCGSHQHQWTRMKCMSCDERWFIRYSAAGDLIVSRPPAFDPSASAPSGRPFPLDESWWPEKHIVAE